MITSLNKRNAQKYKDDLLEYFKSSFVEMKAEIESTLSHGTVNFTPESLIPIWKYLSSKIEILDEHPDYIHHPETPIWFFIQSTGQGNRLIFDKKGYSVESLKYIGFLTYYFYLVFDKNNSELEIDWFICDEKLNGLRSVDRYKPVLWSKKYGGSYFNPFNPILSAALTTWVAQFRDKYSDEYIRVAYSNIQYSLIRSIKNQPETNVRYEISHEDEEENSFTIIFDENLENEIGKRKFSSLEGVLNRIDGVKKAKQQDREIFIIESQLTKESLESKIEKTLNDFFKRNKS